MKKFVVLLLILFCFLLSSCKQDTSGYSYELTSSSWKANLKGGADICLSFDEDIATLSIHNADKNTQIKGKFIADDETLIIFVPEISQNYSFGYTPKGTTLDIIYNGNTITLEKS